MYLNNIRQNTKKHEQITNLLSYFLFFNLELYYTLIQYYSSKCLKLTRIASIYKHSSIL